MIDRASAIAAARERAATRGLEIAEDRVTERAAGWVIPVRKSGAKLPPAQGPYFVDKQSGAVFEVPTARTNEWLDAYDATGKPPPPPTEWKYIGPGEPPNIKRPVGGLRKTRKTDTR